MTPLPGFHRNKPWYLEECASTLATTYSSGTPLHDKSMATCDQDAALRPKHICTVSHTGQIPPSPTQHRSDTALTDPTQVRYRPHRPNTGQIPPSPTQHRSANVLTDPTQVRYHPHRPNTGQIPPSPTQHRSDTVLTDPTQVR